MVSLRRFKNKGSYPFLNKIIHSLYNSFYYLEKNQQLLQNNYLVIKYEYILTDPKDTIKRIARFSNLSMDNNLLVSTSLDEPWSGNSTTNQKFESVSAKQINNWKGEIQNIEITMINKLFPFTLKKYEYEYLESQSPYKKVSDERFKVYIKNRLYRYLRGLAMWLLR
ncbi:sulfotransferase domain-containing protein [Salibacterium salarium]|uniref:sulfotransferase domain-containing protein n=1 Tax=Salibacterium salarium TaxID=284579 RepID=UPI0016399088